MIRLCGDFLSKLAQSSSLPILLLLLLLLLHLCQVCHCDSKCYVCDNYFELNKRNSDPDVRNQIQRRFCSQEDHQLRGEDHQADCIGKDYTGCVKIVTRAWRHHIDKVGYGLRSDNTLLATVVTRDCADVPPAMGYGCHMIIGSSTTTEMCYCKDHYCNQASVIGREPALASVPLFLAIVSLFAVAIV